MVNLKVVSLTASVVYLDVYVEMFLVAVSANLVFGPFNSTEEAQEWADSLTSVHNQNKSVKTIPPDAALFGADGMPTRPYINMEMIVSTVAEHKMARKLSSFLLAPETPEKIEPLLAEYAIRTAHEATAYSCTLFDQKK